MADLYGFDKDSAEKIARVVRKALNTPSQSVSHRRADVSGPGNHVAVAKITETGGNTHKFIFVAATYTEDIGNQTPTFQEVQGEYYAHDLCGASLAVGDKVWIVDHNNQWFIIDRCTDATGTGLGEGCCGACGGGTVTSCSECDVAQNAWHFELTQFGGQMPDDAGCCEQLQGAHFVYHASGCTWKGIDLDNCHQFGSPLAYPAWELGISGLDPWEVTLQLELDQDGDGTKDSVIKYHNPQPWCCDCANTMVLACPDALPTGCDTFPCEICLLPGPKCCASSDIAKNLTATISNTSGCACANGKTVTLIYQPATQEWVGSGTFCTTGGNTHVVDLTLQCETDGGACGDFRLVVSFQDACNSGTTVTPSPSCTCTPLSLPFEGISVDGCCGVASTGATVTITVTG